MIYVSPGPQSTGAVVLCLVLHRRPPAVSARPDRRSPLDPVFHALSNPTRRQVLERLSVGPATVSELAERFDMQLPSFVPHLSVLERSRLARSAKRGRVRTYRITPERFKIAEGWLAARRQQWEARLDRFDQYVARLKDQESPS